MTEEERLKRWRLVLGGDAQDALGVTLDGQTLGMDGALDALYGGERQGGLGDSSPRVARWLGDIRTYFPTPVVQVLQRDALERLNMRQLLLEPELMAALEPDVHLVATLVSLGHVLPAKSRETARHVVRRVVEQLERRLRDKTVQAVRGALSKASRTSRPRPAEIDWPRTIRKNLHTYDPGRRVIVPEHLVGFRHRRPGLRDVILCVDQSGSMAASVVYSGIFAAVLASVRAVRTQLVVFDTAIVDLTAELADPVEVLFGTQLGGGTDINRALAYCQGLVTRPSDTILVLISDLYEGGNAPEMLARAAQLKASGVQVIALLALSDDGAPAFDAHHAAVLASLGIPAFACTPDQFPDLMAAAIQREDLAAWASRHEIVTAGASGQPR
jgi:Mg-chelatase subunit ChlD